MLRHDPQILCDVCSASDPRNRCVECSDYALCDDCLAVGSTSRGHLPEHPMESIPPSSYAPSDTEIDCSVDDGDSRSMVRGGGPSAYDTESQLSHSTDLELDSLSGEVGDDRAHFSLIFCDRELSGVAAASTSGAAAAGSSAGSTLRTSRRRLLRRDPQIASISNAGIGGLLVHQPFHLHSSSSPPSGPAPVSQRSLVSPAGGMPESGQGQKRDSYDTLEALTQRDLARKNQATPNESGARSDCAASVASTSTRAGDSASVAQKHTERKAQEVEVMLAEGAGDAMLESSGPASEAAIVKSKISQRRLRTAFVRKLLLSTADMHL